MKRPILDQDLPRITPADFGAVGDGKTDDSAALQAAIDHASQNGCVLTLDKVEYHCSEVTVLKNLTVHSNNAKISYYGIHKNRPAVDVWDNVNIFGTLNVWAYDNTKESPGNHGGRCGVSFGSYDTGRGAHNCYAEHLVVTGGIPCGNAVFITGDSSDIMIDRVTVPSGTNYWRAVLSHWGNAQEHWPVDHTHPEKGYAHKENAGPSLHPHDLTLGTVEIYDTKRFDGINDGDNAALTLSATYNVTVEELIAHNTAHVTNLLVGDMGFSYALPDVQQTQMRNIHIKRIKGTKIRNTGIHLTAYTVYIPTLLTYSELRVDEMDVEVDAESEKGNGIFQLDTSKLEIGKLTVRNSRGPAVRICRGGSNVKIDELTVIDPNSHALFINSLPEWRTPENVNVGRLTVTGGNAEASMIFAETVKGLFIDTVDARNAVCRCLLKLTDKAKDVQIQTVKGTPRGLKTPVEDDRAQAVIGAYIP